MAQAEALRLTDDNVSASEQLGHALELGALEPALDAEIRIKLADCYDELNDRERSYAVVVPILDNPPDDIWRARALVRVARVLYYRAQPDAAHAACVTAATTLAATHHHLDYALAQLWMGNSMRMWAGVSETRRAFQRATASAERAGSRRLLAAGLGSQGYLEIRCGRLALAEELLLEALAVDTDAGHRPDIAKIRLHLAVCRQHAGDWRGSEESLAGAEDTYRSSGDRKGLALAQIVRARGLRLRGRDGAAALDEAEASAAAAGYVRLRAQVREERGYAALARREPEMARHFFEELLGPGGSDLVGEDVLYDARNGLALALLGLGRRERAAEQARRSLEAARSAGDSLSAAGARTTLGLIEENVEEIQRAIADLSSAGARCELLRAHRAAVDVLASGPERAWHARQTASLEEELGLPSASGVAPATGTLDEARVPIPAALRERIGELARFEGGVLVRGESAVGRGQVAAAIHDASRRKGPLVRLDCRGISSDRFLRELLGEDGLGGAIERAQGGTLALENVDHLGPDARAVLHRELGRFRESGSRCAVVTTAAPGYAPDPDDAFAADLFSRIAGVSINVPSLRERPDDLHAVVQDWTGAKLDPELCTALGSYPWPGNFAELREAVRAALFLAKGAPLHASHFPNVAARSQKAPSLRAMIDELETRQIRRALREANGNKTKAAESLGISRKGLFDRLKRLGLWDES